MDLMKEFEVEITEILAKKVVAALQFHSLDLRRAN